MKKSIVLFSITAFLGTAAFSQSELFIPKKYDKKKFELESLRRPLSRNDSIELKKQLIREQAIRDILQRRQGKYSHSVINGKVYVMPNDNMPCLVPNKTATASMPGATPAPKVPGNMPNAIPPQKLIPDNKE